MQKIIPYSEPWNLDPDPNFVRISGSESVLVGMVRYILRRDRRPGLKVLRVRYGTIVVLFRVCFLFFTTYEISIEILSRLQSIPDPSV